MKALAPLAVHKAIEHVRKFHPDVVQVIYGPDTRWQFLDVNGDAPVFAKNTIDVAILEEAQDAIESFPAHFVYMA